MKRISYLFFLVFLTSLLSTSCTKTKTYSELLNDEQTLIGAYIKRNNINVLSSFPADKKWGPNDYVLTPTGLYFHLVDSGNTSIPDTLQLKNTVVDRYKKYTLNIASDTISNWNTIDFPIPDEFVYGDLTQSFKGFQEAVTYMKRNDSEAKIIVPSIIGIQADMMSVTPYGYYLKIKILK